VCVLFRDRLTTTRPFPFAEGRGGLKVENQRIYIIDIIIRRSCSGEGALDAALLPPLHKLSTQRFCVCVCVCVCVWRAESGDPCPPERSGPAVKMDD
jgi:hypothetical protein